jgi:hypothetical protein
VDGPPKKRNDKKESTMKNLSTVLTILSMVVMPCLVVAQNNATCVTETNALLDSTPAVEAAYADMQTALENDLKANPTSFCDILNRECSINVGAYSADLKTTCEAEDGQLVEKDLVATCNGNVGGVPLNDFLINVFKAPLCAGASCDPDDLPDEIENDIESILTDVVKEIEAVVGGNLKCTVQIVDEGATTASGVQATAALTTAAGVTLFSFIVM